MRLLIDLDELEALARLFERETTELAGITIDLRRRLSTDLLDRVATYGLPTRNLGYDCERVSQALVAHVSELERFTLDLERAWAEAKGLAQDGRVTPGIHTLPDLWWFANAASAGGGVAESQAFAAAATPVAPPVEVTAVALASTITTVSPADRALTGWRALDVVVSAAGLRHNNPPAKDQAYRPGKVGSWHGRDGGHARDYGMIEADAFAIAALLRPLAIHRPDLIPELFGADGIGTDEGSPYQPENHTDDHTHVAIRQGVTAGDLLAALGDLT